MTKQKDQIFFETKLKLISERENILDVGGANRFSKGLVIYKEWFKNSNFKSFDIQGAGADIEGDIHDMPIESNSVDAIICNAVLEHIKNPIKATEEIYRILKPGGITLIQVPSIYPYHPNKNYGDYWRFFEDTLRYMFKDFSSIEIMKQGGFFRAMVVFLPINKRLLERPAVFLDNFFKTEKIRTTTRGFYIFATK